MRWALEARNLGSRIDFGTRLQTLDARLRTLASGFDFGSIGPDFGSMADLRTRLQTLEARLRTSKTRLRGFGAQIIWPGVGNSEYGKLGFRLWKLGFETSKTRHRGFGALIWTRFGNQASDFGSMAALDFGSYCRLRTFTLGQI